MMKKETAKVKFERELKTLVYNEFRRRRTGRVIVLWHVIKILNDLSGNTDHVWGLKRRT